MFDILVYLFDNYHAPAACPEADVLARRLAAAGFTHDDIDEALSWLSGLAESTASYGSLANSQLVPSTRIYADLEQQLLGSEVIGFIMFLENAGIINPLQREIIIDRALSVGEQPLGIDGLRIVVLIVLWSQEADIDHLILEELLSDSPERHLH